MDRIVNQVAASRLDEGSRPMDINEQIRSEVERLRGRERRAFDYLREKINQLLQVMGTLPLKPEELDDDTLIALDPIGIIADSFSQVLEHLRETNEDLSLARDEIQAIFDSAGTAIVVVDSQLQIEAINAVGKEAFFGKCEADPVGNDLIKAADRSIGKNERRYLEAALRSDVVTELTDFSYGDQHYHVVSTPVTSSDKEISSVVFGFTDITRHKHYERSLHEAKVRLNTIVNSVQAGIILVDVETHEIIDVNDSAVMMIGDSRENVIGARCHHYMCPADEGKCPVGDLDQRMDNSERTLVRATGEEIPILKTVIPLTLDDRKVYLETFIDISERKRAEQEIQRLAHFDTLTGLPNRALLHDRLSETLARASREGSLVGVLFLDLDRFKPINDSMGHAVGDKLLEAVAERLSQCVRSYDTVARLGGDEFVVTLSDVRQGLDATSVARAIIDQISQPFEIDGREIFTSISVGIALYPIDGEDAGTLLRNADMAMYEAKAHGRNTYQFYSEEMNRKAHERLEMETCLRHALRQDELYLCYQPQLDVSRGRVTGVEVLLRWDQPTLGPISPAQFIPVAEDTGLIVPIGEWALRTACAQAKAWQDQGVPPFTVAVNLSGIQFNQKDLAEMVSRVLADTGLAPGLLELELTESILMEHLTSTIKTLRALKAMGVRLSIDDFGTGYSSLHYLKNFPLDRIKIAQEFVRDLSTDPGDAAIVETIIAMAGSLDLEVIAEGVETLDQLKFLRARECTSMQGYYFSYPIPGPELTPYLVTWFGEGRACPCHLNTGDAA